MQKQHGAALITVMIMSVIVMAILANVFYRHGINAALTRQNLHSEQAALLALSGESWAVQVLKEDDPDIDHLDETWAIGLPILPLEGGSIAGQLEDLQGRFNINRFQNYSGGNLNAAANSQRNSEFTMLQALAEALEIQIFQHDVASLIDWLDADNHPLPGGAEANEYLLQQPPYRPANGPLVNIDELLLLANMDAERLAVLRPYLNTLPDDTTTGSHSTAVNVNTASVPVLQSLHPDIDISTAENLLELREQNPWQTVNDFYDDIAPALGLPRGADAKSLIEGQPQTPADNNNTSQHPTVVTPVVVKSSYFLLTVYVELGRNRIALESIIHRKTPDNVIVLARTLRYIPNVAAVASLEP